MKCLWKCIVAIFATLKCKQIPQKIILCEKMKNIDDNKPLGTYMYDFLT